MFRQKEEELLFQKIIPNVSKLPDIEWGEARRGVKLSASSRNMELQISAELQISPINSQNISITQTVVLCKIQP